MEGGTTRFELFVSASRRSDNISHVCCSRKSYVSSRRKHNGAITDNQWVRSKQHQTGSRKHNEDGEIAQVQADCLKRQTNLLACSLNQACVHVVWCLLFRPFFLKKRNKCLCTQWWLLPTGASLPPFFFSQKWLLEISKWCTMANNLRRM